MNCRLSFSNQYCHLLLTNDYFWKFYMNCRSPLLLILTKDYLWKVNLLPLLGSLTHLYRYYIDERLLTTPVCRLIITLMYNNIHMDILSYSPV